jgi:predicted nucleotidyltransferase component of viral defense system
VIPMANILEWRAKHQWQTLSQVEQDLLLSRCMVDLFSRDDLAQRLAMRGGTILHKVHFAPARRYSEDLDLVQIEAGPIGPIFDAVKETLSPLLGKPKRDVGPGVATLTYTVPSESGPPPALRIKVEINTREHFAVEPYDRLEFAVASRWFTGACRVTTFSLNELLGTKMRALFQRRKGRDLYDIWLGLQHQASDPKRIVATFEAYMKAVAAPVSRQEYLDNLTAKIAHPGFLSDLPPLLAEGAGAYDPQIACQNVCDRLVALIGSGPKRKTDRAG